LLEGTLFGIFQPPKIAWNNKSFDESCI
jgi:hypothetical protein